MRDIRKFIIGVIQDYCNIHGYTYESEHFALSSGTHIYSLMQKNQLSVETIKKHIVKYSGFLLGNSINPEFFSVELFREIQRNEYGGADCTLGAARLDTLRRQDWTPVKTAKFVVN